jgi:hypothetical protein
MQPLVSILLPNLNNRSFLQERIDTIRSQTLSDWELVVVDNHSEDGAWEFFQHLPQSDPRILIRQAPREGMYANWNNCLRLARGQYIYIATSDDTMAPDCLQKMVEALDACPDCGLAHCRLRMVDEQGGDVFDWWSGGSIFARSSGNLFGRRHIRRAPFDGLLHLTGESVYVSITQLLMRRKVFDQVGLFETRWGSVGDFNWCMRASLGVDTVHVPETWGGWRTHARQATAAASLGSVEHRRKIDEMIQHAIESSAPQLRPEIREELSSAWETYARQMRQTSWQLSGASTSVGRKLLLLRQLLAGSVGAREHLKARLHRMPLWPEGAPELVRSWLLSAGIASAVVPV